MNGCKYWPILVVGIRFVTPTSYLFEAVDVYLCGGLDDSGGISKI